MQKTIRLYGLLLATMGMALASCVSDDTDMDDIIAQYMVDPVSIELDYSDLSEAADVVVTDENDSAARLPTSLSPMRTIRPITTMSRIHRGTR